MYGSVREGRLMAMAGQSGYQTAVLRGGFHYFLWIWQYRIHKMPLCVIPQGKIGYVFARDGEPLKPEQTLARVVPCNHFQDARAFLAGDHNPLALCGQRGRQRAISHSQQPHVDRPSPTSGARNEWKYPSTELISRSFFFFGSGIAVRRAIGGRGAVCGTRISACTSSSATLRG